MEKICIDYIIEKIHPDGILNMKNLGEMLFFKNKEVIKTIRLRTKNRFGSVLLDGDVGFFLCLNTNTRFSGKLERPDSFTACPIMNFPDIVSQSTLKDGRVSEIFIIKIKLLLNKMPNTLQDIDDKFGEDFLNRNVLERIQILAKYLRCGVNS